MAHRRKGEALGAFTNVDGSLTQQFGPGEYRIVGVPRMEESGKHYEDCLMVADDKSDTIRLVSVAELARVALAHGLGIVLDPTRYADSVFEVTVLEPHDQQPATVEAEIFEFNDL